MPRPLSIALITTLCVAFSARADDKAKPSPAVKKILDKAVAAVKKNQDALKKANAAPLGTARDELNKEAKKQIECSNTSEAQAINALVRSLETEVVKMATEGSKSVIQLPVVQQILERAVGEVKANREACDRSNQTPLSEAREALQELAKKLVDEGKPEESSATLQHIETLERDVLSQANASAPSKPGADKPAPMSVIPAQRGAVPWNGHKYKVFKEPCSWPDAKRLCEEMGGHLVTIDSRNEQAAVVDVLRLSGMAVDNSKASWRSVWIGATDEAKEGQWLWVDGSAVEGPTWHVGQPDNFGGRSHSAALLLNHGGAWDDVIGTEKNPFMCEWDR